MSGARFERLNAAVSAERERTIGFYQGLLFSARGNRTWTKSEDRELIGEATRRVSAADTLLLFMADYHKVEYQPMEPESIAQLFI